MSATFEPEDEAFARLYDWSRANGLVKALHFGVYR